MIVLGIDTATDRLSVAVGEPGGVVVGRTAMGARRHTSLLVALLEESLGELGASLDQVAAIAVSDGPGSFTGLRVAAAWAKGMARARGLPVWTASTLLVRAAPHARPGETVFGVGTALRGELYLAGYRIGERRIEVILAPTVLAAETGPPAALAADCVVGDSDQAALGRWRWAGAPRLVGAPAGLPNAASLIGLIGRPGGAIPIHDVAGWEPTYGRLAEAQVKWERAHGRSLADPSGHGR